MKKLLILGAMQMHVPIIKRARERGLYVITCDYLKENEGHKFADECYFESTTDLNAVLSLSKRLNIDGIMTFNSDPAALSAAYVSENLGLPGNSYNTIKIMSDKNQFRHFLKSNNFNVPWFKSYKYLNTLIKDIDSFTFPVMVKPVDSSGSKGVSKISDASDLTDAFNEAMDFSRKKEIIVEEYIEGIGPQIHGDAFVFNGKIVFSYFGDHHFDKSINDLVPYSTTFPSKYSNEILNNLESELQRFINLVEFKQGGINVEARISKDREKVYLIEVGPRNGGNFTPIIIQYASGFNFIDAALDSAMGIQYKEQRIYKHGNYAYLVLHSVNEGLFENLELSDEIKPFLLESFLYKKKHDKVFSFMGANAAIGVLLVHFKSMKEMDFYVDNFQDFYKINFHNE